MWLCRGRVSAPRRLWPLEELAALSEGGGLSFTDHLCNNWVVLFVMPGDGLDEGIGSFHQCFFLH